jgi:hypothetical protein
MQERPLWPVLICGDAARRVVMGIGGKEASAPHKNPLPAGEGGSHRVAGTVIAVFARSFYLADAAGGLACVGPLGLGRGPLNMLCELPCDLDWPARGLRPGIGARRDGMTLCIDGIGAFSLTDAVMWRPPSPPEKWHAGTLTKGLAALAARAASETRQVGFVSLVEPLARGSLDEAAACTTASPLRHLARPAIIALAEWLAADSDDPPGGAAEMLLGLGPGLTPSGDDFLGGALIALHTLGRADIAARLAAWALPLARERTGAISLAHLACAAAGEGSAALHDLLAALLAADEAGIAAGVAALAAIGHSSGWDMLAGATLACATLVCVGLSA